MRTERRRKGVYGPRPGFLNLVFVDDLNLPEKEKFFAQPPVEALRQLLANDGSEFLNCNVGIPLEHCCLNLCVSVCWHRLVRLGGERVPDDSGPSDHRSHGAAGRRPQRHHSPHDAALQSAVLLRVRRPDAEEDLQYHRAVVLQHCVRAGESEQLSSA